MARVEISRNPDKLLLLAEKVIKKHEADAAQSPLLMVNIADLKTKMIAARQKYAIVQQMRKEAEALTQEVQQLLGIHKNQNTGTEGTILFYINQCRDVLRGIYRSMLKQLGDWGFEVNDSRRKTKEEEPAI